jgi:Domain of unknown function (DUF4345)
MSTFSARALSTILVVLGLANIFLGINTGVGGLETLGWQGDGTFFQVTDEHLYLIRDSHTRFYGGLYIAIGLFLIIAATNTRRYRTGLYLVFGMIFAGGLARLSVLRGDVILDSDLTTSLIIELIGMPLLAIWLRRVVSTTPRGITPAPVS